MQRAATYIFIAISALAMAVVLSRRERFDPDVNLPKIDAGKPFTKWDGVVLTLKRDGKLLLNGMPIDRDNVYKQVRGAIWARDNEFKEAKSRLPYVWREFGVCVTPVLLCIDKDTSLHECFKLIDLISYNCRGCLDVSFAVQKPTGPGAVSFFTHFYIRCPHCYRDDPMYCYWKGEAIILEGKIREIKVIGYKSRRYRILTSISSRMRPSAIPIIDGYKPETFATVEPLFELIEKQKSDVIVVVLDFNHIAENLTWDWLIRLLVRLEESGIKGYSFAAPEIPY